MPELHGSHILSATLAGCLACTAGAQVQNAPAAPGASPASVRPGLEVLLRDSLELVENRRIGLVTNQSGIDARGRRGLDLMLAAGLDVAAGFSPGHGVARAPDVGQTPDRRGGND